MILYFRQFGKFFYVFFIFPTHRIKKCKVAFAEFVGKQTERGIVSKSLELPR